MTTGAREGLPGLAVAALAEAAAPAAGETLRVREVAGEGALAAIGPVWRSLESTAETRSPFLTHEWATSWWQHFGAGQELRLLLVEDQLGPAALAPLARAVRGAGPFRYCALEILGTGPLRFLGMGLADRADFLLARRREESLRAIAVHLAAHRDDWEVLDLRFVPADSTTARLLPAVARELGLGAAMTPCSRSPFITIEGPFDAYLERRSGNFRKGLKRKRRKLEELGPVHIDVDAAGRRDPEALLAQLVEVSRASWKARAGSALLMHEPVRRFFATLIPRLQAAGLFYLAVLEVASEVGAHELGFVFDRKLWSYDSAYKERLADGSPGILLTAAILERAFAEGRSEYDFGRGDHAYKMTWQSDARSEVQIAIDSGGARARAARRLLYDLKWRLKASPRAVALQGRLAGLANRLLERRRP